MIFPLPVLRPVKEERGPRRVPERTWTWLAVVMAALGFAFGGELGRWIGFALLLTVGPGMLEPLRRLPLWQRERERVLRWLPLALVLGLATLLLGDLILGRPPISRDHGVHYFQTKVLVDELIPSGRLHGWSERLNSGYPFGDSYPVLGYLMTGAAHLLSFGLISLRTSYAWGLLAVWGIALGAVAWLAGLIAQELRGEEVERAPQHEVAPTNADEADTDAESGGEAPAESAPSPSLAAWIDPRWAAALAAIAYLIDPGASREGGWNYLMFHGVWPQLLSSALWVASLPATWTALRRPSPRSLALAALLLGGSVLAHPFGMLTAATSAVAWPVVVWATGAARKLPKGQLRWWALIHVFAGLVCAGWLVTFLMSAGSMSRSPVPWKPLGALTAELLTGELFRDYRAWIGPLTVIGLFATIRRGRALGWLGLGLICALFVLASEASITVVRLDLLVSSFKNLQFPRYSLALKPLLYCFAGVGGALLIARLRQLPTRDHPASSAVLTRPRVGRLIAALCLAPLIVGALDSGDRFLPNPVGGVKVFAGSPHGEVEAALREALELEVEALAGEATPRPMTVAFLRRRMGGGTYVLFSITDLDADLVMDGHIPAVNYKYQVRRRGPNALRSMGVTHVLYDRPLGGNADDNRLTQELELVGEFGVWTLGRLGPGKVAEHFRTQGALEASEVSVERSAPATWRIEVSAGQGRVEIPVGPYRNWFGTDEEGEQVALEAILLARAVPALSVPFEGPGVIELHYRTPTIERVAGGVSLAAIVLLLLALISGRELVLAARLDSPRAATISGALALVSLAAILAASYVKQERQLSQTWDAIIDAHAKSGRMPGDRKLRLREDLVDTRAFSVARSNPDGCDGTLGKDALAGCTQDDAEPRASMIYRSPYLYRCLRVKLPPRASVDIELEGLREGDDLAGFFNRQDRNFAGIVLGLPGQERDFTPAGNNKRQHFHVTAEARGGEKTLRVRNDKDYERRLCFALAALTPAE